MKEKWLLAFCLFAWVLSACVGSRTDSDSNTEMVKLKMSISDNLSYGPIFIAEEEGYFSQYGLEIEYVTLNRSSEAVALLSAGKLDVYAGTLNTGLINAIRESNAIKVVADRGRTEPGNCTYQAIVIRKDLFESGQVTEPADLKGLRFSASTAGPAAYLLSEYLSQGGVTFEDLDIIDIPTLSEFDGYATGSLDGSVAPEPDLTRLINTGDTAILARAEDVLGTFQSGVIAFGTQLMVESPEVGARFMAAYLAGVRQYNQGKTDRNLAIISAAIGETAEDVASFCWVSVREDGRIDFESIDRFQHWSITQGHLSEPVSEEVFWDSSFLEAASQLIQSNK